MVDIADYIVDYNALAAEGKLTKLVGRAAELERIVQILLRYSKNNPVITGLAGVGKKTLVYGFADLLAKGNVPDELKDYKLVGVDVSSLLIDSVSSEEYEENVKKLFAYLREGKYIVMIKDAGLLIRRDTDDGTREIAKYLKPKVLAGEARIIMAVDTISFKGMIENDSELMTVMQVIRLDECSVKEALSITKGSKARMEEHYSVKIDDDAVEAAVVLTHRYVKNRLFPEKSIDLMDDACSLTLMDIADGKTDERRVTKHHMERTIGIWTGIPMDKVQEEDKERLAKMDDYLRQRVIGQDEAVKAVSDAFRRSKSGLQDPNRPLGTFLFIGTTGVGKTELAKSLAEFVFYDETCLIRIDMSEFMDKASIVRLVGPPAGSPGYEQGGLLTEAIRNKPYQLILFDEIEKAHPEVMNLMLQLLDEGRLTDSRGVTVDFRNTIVILTSNIGHDVPSYKRISVLTKYLRPELVNRIDDIVSFNQLVENDMLKIVELNLRKLIKKAKAAQNLTLDITVYAKRWFVDELFTSKMGVRALKRLIQHEVENVMAIQIMNDEIQYGDTVVIDSPDRTKLLIYSKEHGAPNGSAVKDDEKKTAETVKEETSKTPAASTAKPAESAKKEPTVADDKAKVVVKEEAKADDGAKPNVDNASLADDHAATAEKTAAGDAVTDPKAETVVVATPADDDGKTKNDDGGVQSGDAESVPATAKDDKKETISTPADEGASASADVQPAKKDDDAENVVAATVADDAPPAKDDDPAKDAVATENDGAGASAEVSVTVDAPVSQSGGSVENVKKDDDEDDDVPATAENDEEDDAVGAAETTPRRQVNTYGSAKQQHEFNPAIAAAIARARQATARRKPKDDGGN